MNRENQSDEIELDLLKVAEDLHKSARGQSLYDILGIPTGVGIQRVKDSYRLLTNKTPITDGAYAVLSDPAQKQEYDAELQKQEAAPRGSWVDQWGSERWSGHPKNENEKAEFPDNTPLAKLVNIILTDAVKRGATAINIQIPQVYFFINDEWQLILNDVPEKLKAAVTSRLKTMTRGCGEMSLKMTLDDQAMVVDFNVSFLNENVLVKFKVR